MPTSKPKAIRKMYISNGQAHQLLNLFWHRTRREHVPLTRRELDNAMRRAGVQFDRELWHDLVDTGCIKVKPIYGSRKEHIETICELTLQGKKLARELERPQIVTRRIRRNARPAKYTTAPWLDPAAIRAPVRALQR